MNIVKDSLLTLNRNDFDTVAARCAYNRRAFCCTTCPNTLHFHEHSRRWPSREQFLFHNVLDTEYEAYATQVYRFASRHRLAILESLQPIEYNVDIDVHSFRWVCAVVRTIMEACDESPKDWTAFAFVEKAMHYYLDDADNDCVDDCRNGMGAPSVE